MPVTDPVSVAESVPRSVTARAEKICADSVEDIVPESALVADEYMLLDSVADRAEESVREITPAIATCSTTETAPESFDPEEEKMLILDDSAVDIDPTSDPDFGSTVGGASV